MSTIYTIGNITVTAEPLVQGGIAGVCIEVRSSSGRWVWGRSVRLEPRTPRWWHGDMTIPQAVAYAVEAAQEAHRREQDAQYATSIAKTVCEEFGAEARALAELEQELGTA